jgi:hypothetical protein
MVAPERRRFAGLRPLYAWLLLGVTFSLSVYGVCIHARTWALVIGSDDPNKTDYALYERIVNRVHAGEGYYQAAGSEMRAGGYAMRPFLTWRLPTLACLMALFPSASAGQIPIVWMVIAALWFWVRCLKNEGRLWMSIVGGVMLFCSLGVAMVWPSYLQHDYWSGVCIALSLALYARGHWQFSVAFGLLALFLRELAFPFVFVMLATACWQRRKGEALAWLVGVAGFAVFLGIHAWMVNRQLTAADVRTGPGWLHLGGWPFVVKTARSNFMLLASPSWVAGLFLPFLLLGLANWRSEIGTRVALTVGIYVVAFLFAGRTNQAYWGLMYSSLLPLGFVFAPRALGDLLQATWPGGVPAPQQVD